MPIEALKSSLDTFGRSQNNFATSIYAILKGQENTPLKIDIEGDALSGLRALFIQNIRDAIIENNSISLQKLSSADERRNAIYEYDIDVPPEFSSMHGVSTVDSPNILNLDDHPLLKIKALLVEIGTCERQLVLYKTMAPVNIFGRASFFLVKSGTRMERINEEFLRISPDFQLLQFDGKLYVLDLQLIERSFGFRKIITKEAHRGIASITSKEILANPEVLRDLVSEMKFARRLTKIATDSPVIRNNILNSDIIDFCKTFPKLKDRIRFDPEGKKILLDTKVSKDLFIKLLMDDFLTSELTRFHYESLAKDSVTE